jgi:hypothetical protein
MNPKTDRTTAAVTILTALSCLALTAVRANPPSPRELASDGSFSAVSAQKILEGLYASGVTHHIGTENNRLLKEQILSHLRLLGYEPTVQSTMACWESDGCGHVENILARLPGKGTGKAVLLAVHYDSVGAGPSVSDDGVAVAATLEIARILKSGPQLDNDVIFLIDDGEEAFLLGAVAFAAKHPWAKDVGAVVNLEARGSAGRSYMFETGTNNAWLIELMKKNVPRPASSSLFYSIYQRLPNDTDFTVFKHYGMNGVNFAFIKNVVHYHTPLDDLTHATPATIQHHGDNALGMVRALAEADLASPATGTSSWFDIWGFGILSWPESGNLPLAISSLLLVAFAVAIHSRRGDLSMTQLRRGLAIFPLALLSAAFLSLMAAWILSSVGKLPDWPATAWAPKIAFWLIGIGASAMVISIMGRKTGGLATWLGSLFWLGLFAILLSVALPGAAYLFLVPALVGGCLTALMSVWRAAWAARIAFGFCIVAASASQLVMAWSLWDAMGIPIMPLVTILVAAMTMLVLAPAAGILANSSRKIPLSGLTLAGVLVVLSLALPAYSIESPRALNLYFVQDADTGRARLAVQPGPRSLPDPIIEAVDWNDELERFYPWQDGEPAIMVTEVDAIPVSSPQIELLEQEDKGDERRIRARLSSSRLAARGALVFSQPERIESLQLEGWHFDLQTEEIRAWYADGRRVVRFATMPVDGIEFELTISGEEPFEVFVLDYSFGLPLAGDVLTVARPENVVPRGQGDLTVVYARTEL